MNCDHVFEILTRGPFPSGDACDDAVERHLCACHECRQLAEALRPAVSLFHEAVEPEEVAGLPGYRGALPVASAQRLPAVSTAVAWATPEENRTVCRARRVPAGFRWPTLQKSALGATALRVAAAGMLAGALCLVVFGLSGMQIDSDPPQLASGADALKASNLLDPSLAVLDLPESCFRLAADAPLDRHNRALCCTNCHASGAPQAPQLGAGLATVIRSCSLCHES